MKKQNKTKSDTFFISLTKKIKTKNPDLDVGLHTFKIPKGFTRSDVRKIMAQVGRRLGTVPTEVKVRSGKTAKAIVEDVTKWRKDRDKEQKHK